MNCVSFVVKFVTHEQQINLSYFEKNQNRNDILQTFIEFLNLYNTIAKEALEPLNRTSRIKMYKNNARYQG